MTSSIPTPTATGDVTGEVSGVAGAALREPGRAAMGLPQLPRPVPFIFVSGFVLGAIAAAATNLFGRRRRMPFVRGNRNVFVSLPFSGITMAAPSIRARGAMRRPRGQRGQRGFGRWSRGMARGMAQSMARGAASGVARGVVRGRKRGR